MSPEEIASVLRLTKIKTTKEKMSVKIWIIATGWNCEKYARKCIDSVLAQSYENFHLIIINDGSTDSTEKSLAGLSGNKTTIFNYGENLGAAYRRWMVMMNPQIGSEDVILLLGLDDELLPGALEKIAAQYEAGKWMTYGNWINQRGRKNIVPLGFPPIVHAKRSYRSIQYRSTAPNTFKKKLILQLTEDDFKVNGEWVQSCTETNLMFCCLEMCGEKRIGIIYDPIYLYNESRKEGSLDRWGSKYKLNLLSIFQQRPIKELLKDYEHESR